MFCKDKSSFAQIRQVKYVINDTIFQNSVTYLISMKSFLSFSQLNKIKLAFISPYIFIFLSIIIIFTLLNVYLNEIYVVGFRLFRFNPYVSIPYIFFLVSNTFLVGLSLTLGFIRFKELGLFSANSTLTSFLGSFFAILTGACPGCISGLLPTFAGFFGASFNLNSLPLYGLEIQFLSSILLVFGVYSLSKEVVCKL